VIDASRLGETHMWWLHLDFDKYSLLQNVSRRLTACTTCQDGGRLDILIQLTRFLSLLIFCQEYIADLSKTYKSIS
jgi:hypothetical protein